jgi:hypothetical protein
MSCLPCLFSKILLLEAIGKNAQVYIEIVNKLVGGESLQTLHVQVISHTLQLVSIKGA